MQGRSKVSRVYGQDSRTVYAREIQIKQQRLCVNANKGTYRFYKEQITTPDFYFNSRPTCDQIKSTYLIKLVEQRRCAGFLLFGGTKEAECAWKDVHTRSLFLWFHSSKFVIDTVHLQSCLEKPESFCLTDWIRENQMMPDESRAERWTFRLKVAVRLAAVCLVLIKNKKGIKRFLFP